MAKLNWKNAHRMRERISNPIGMNYSWKKASSPRTNTMATKVNPSLISQASKQAHPITLASVSILKGKEDGISS